MHAVCVHTRTAVTVACRSAHAHSSHSSARPPTRDPVPQRSFTSRVDCVLPFFPFTGCECAVAAQAELLNLQEQLEAPPNEPERRVHGNITLILRDQPQVSAHSWTGLPGSRLPGGRRRADSWPARGSPDPCCLGAGGGALEQAAAGSSSSSSSHHTCIT